MFSRRLIAIILLVSMLGWAVPVRRVLDASNAGVLGLPALQAPKDFGSLPPFPEDAKRPLPDFSGIDWDKEVVLPADQTAYAKQAEKLAEQGNAKEASALKPTVRHMGDDEVMAAYNIPPEVQVLVRQYRQSKNKAQLLPGQTAGSSSLADELKFNIEQWQNTRQPNALATAAPDLDASAGQTEEIDVRKTKKLAIKNLTPASPAAPEIKLARPTLSAQPDLDVLPGPNFSQAQTQAETSKIIDYYAGIENKPVDYILYQLSLQQNPDGSFGSFNQYQITAEIASALSRFNKTSSGQYAAMIRYLTDAAPKDTREKAIKARLMKDWGEPYQSLLDELAAAKNADNGYGLKPGFASDAETSAEVAKTLYLGGRPADLSYTLSQIHSDGTMYYYRSLKPSLSLMARVAQTLKPMAGLPAAASGAASIVNNLLNRYDSEQKTIPGADLIDQFRVLQTLQLYNANPSAQADWQKQLIDNGSFIISNSTLQAATAALNDLALPDLIITSITSNTASLVNRSPANFTLTIKNQGSAPAASLRLFNFVDQFLMNGSGLDVSGLMGGALNPGQDVQVNVDYPDTVSFIGDTSFEFYAEAGQDADSSNNWKTQNFNFAGPANSFPALPVYYIADKHSISGTPALNVRWPQKTDPNRLNYVIMTRKSGTVDWNFTGIDDTWNGAFIYGVFEEGSTYDVTAGVLHKDQQTVSYFTDITRVKTTSSDNLYTSAVTGTATVDNQPTAGLSFAGYGTSGRSGTAGNFSLSNLPNGSSASWINHLQYEKLITKFSLPQNSTTTAVRLFTRLKDDASAPTIPNLSLRPFFNSRIKNQNTLTINITQATDNVGLKEADFYYFKPDESAWVFIGSSSFQSGSQAWLDWFVPSALLGDGYKIKAVAWDFQGNQSEPKESPVFTITSGALPSGTITVQGLTDNKWALGETKTISWDITSPSGISSLQNISLQAGGTYNYLANNYDASKHSITFTMPLQASYVNSAAYIKIFVNDNNFNETTITSATFEITDPSPPPQAPWGTPQVLDIFSTVYPLSRSLVAVFPKGDGSLEIIYYEYDGQPYQDPGQYNRIVYRKFNGTEWLSPVIVKEYLYLYGQTPSPHFSDITAAPGPNGDMHIAYTLGTGGGLAGLDAADVYYARISGGSLASTRQMTSDGTLDTGVQIAASPQGKVFLAWNGGYSYVNQTGFSFLHYAEADSSGVWSGVSGLTNGWTGRPALALEGESPLLAYMQDDQFYFIKNPAGSWTPPAVINQPSIPKPELDKYTEDAAKLALIVSPDSQNPARYKWLDSVNTKARLADALTVNTFVNKDGILDSWRKNEYPYNSLTYNLFAAGGGAYDLFLRATEDQTNYLYNIRHVNFSVNPQNNQSQTLKDAWLGRRGAGEDVRNYTVVKSANGLYHLLYVKQTGSQSHVYHSVYDGQDVYFTASLASPYLYAQEYSLMLAENNSLITAYFGGGGGQLFNTADYSPIINYRLRPIAPVYGGGVHTNFANLSWSLNNPAGSAYDVYFGEDPDLLTTVATGLTATSTRVSDLIEGRAYYWQVVANSPSGLIYSNIWRFEAQGPEVCSPPLGGDWQIDSSCILSASAIAPANVIVAPGVVVTIMPGAILRVDFKRYKLLVRKGGGVLIKKGGAVRQKQ